MAKWGKVDFEELKELQERLLEMEKQADEFCRAAARVLAARLLEKAVPLTPRGTYPLSSGKSGGTLKRGWLAKTHEEAAGGSGVPTAQKARAYAMSLPIAKSGGNYTIEIVNPVEYASYVEFGHRTVNGGSVEGKYFLTTAEKIVENERQHILEMQLHRFLKRYFS